MDHLQQWHKEYVAVEGSVLNQESPIILAVNLDRIDISHVETQIELVRSTTNVLRGYCNDCQHLFSHWPDLGTKPWTHAIGRPCCTNELEAATRNGCKSCAFLLSKLKAAGLLNTFRRIEKRLSLLNDTATTASISIQNRGSHGGQLLWLNFPGKVAQHCTTACALQTTFASDTILASGKNITNSIFKALTGQSKLL